jgi:hypothetical protein
MNIIKTSTSFLVTTKKLNNSIDMLPFETIKTTTTTFKKQNKNEQDTTTNSIKHKNDQIG